jgi:hypothetical protein
MGRKAEGIMEEESQQGAGRAARMLGKSSGWERRLGGRGDKRKQTRNAENKGKWTKVEKEQKKSISQYFVLPQHGKDCMLPISLQQNQVEKHVLVALLFISVRIRVSLVHRVWRTGRDVDSALLLAIVRTHVVVMVSLRKSASRPTSQGD